MDYQRTLHEIDGLLNKIIRNGRLSDYEKELQVSAHIIIPLLDKIKGLEDLIDKTEDELIEVKRAAGGKYYSDPRC